MDITDLPGLMERAFGIVLTCTGARQSIYIYYIILYIHISDKMLGANVVLFPDSRRYQIWKISMKSNDFSWSFVMIMTHAFSPKSCDTLRHPQQTYCLPMFTSSSQVLFGCCCREYQNAMTSFGDSSAPHEPFGARNGVNTLRGGWGALYLRPG